MRKFLSLAIGALLLSASAASAERWIDGVDDNSFVVVVSIIKADKSQAGAWKGKIFTDLAACEASLEADMGGDPRWLIAKQFLRHIVEQSYGEVTLKCMSGKEAKVAIATKADI